jgi:transcriptional regulator with XRE-family HTH domain
MNDERARLGARLKAAREYLGLSQQEVAQAIEGLSRSAISLIESGQRNVTASELKSLAALYEKPMAELTGAENIPELPEEASFVARQMTKLSAQDRAEVVRFTELLLGRRASNKS